MWAVRRQSLDQTAPAKLLEREVVRLSGSRRRRTSCPSPPKAGLTITVVITTRSPETPCARCCDDSRSPPVLVVSCSELRGATHNPLQKLVRPAVDRLRLVFGGIRWMSNSLPHHLPLPRLRRPNNHGDAVIGFQRGANLPKSTSIVAANLKIVNSIILQSQHEFLMFY